MANVLSEIQWEKIENELVARIKAAKPGQDRDAAQALRKAWCALASLPESKREAAEWAFASENGLV